MNAPIPSTELASESSWYKSSYSSGSGNSCVEIANLVDGVGIRDSKQKQGPALVVTSAAWSSFITLICDKSPYTTKL